MNNRLIILLTITMLILMGLLVWAAPAQASGLYQDTGQPEKLPDCRECHWEVYLDWEESAHGQGLSCGQCHLADLQDSHAREGHAAQSGLKACMSCHTTGYNAVTDTWEEDNVHCTACHSPIPPEHPDKPVPVNRSSELCGQCHIEAQFEWKNSAHGMAGVTCVSCHSQHTTGLRSESVTAQCANCHGPTVDGFGHSEHATAGLSCEQCHLLELEGELGSGAAKRDHSFAVELRACTACHSYQLHASTGAPVVEQAAFHELKNSAALDAMASNAEAVVCPQPQQVGPLQVGAVLGLVSLGLGGAAFPHLSRWTKPRPNKHSIPGEPHDR